MFYQTGTAGGVHAFERAGLGFYPFRCVKVEKREASCAYCGEPLMYPCVVSDRDGKEFDVGCECVTKSGDSGLLRHIKTSETYRAIQRQKRAARDEVIKSEIEELMAHPAISETGLASYYRGRLTYCGAAGRARVRKDMKDSIARAADRESL